MGRVKSAQTPPAAGPSPPPPGPDHVLVVGDGELPAELADVVTQRGARCVHLRRPTDRDLTRAVQAAPRFVAVITHDDIEALRLALVAEHTRPGIALLVTIFDATVASQVLRTVPNCHVVSLADTVAPILSTDCLGGMPRRTSWRRAGDHLRTQLRPHDASSRLLLCGVAGLLGLIGAETLIAAVAFDHALPSAFYEAAKATAAVGPDSVAEHGPAWYQVIIGVAMLLGTALTAVATAGLINRLLSRRLVTLLGRRTLPRRNHVVVVGLGQVGLRLCLLLRQQGIPVVAIERERYAANVHLAKSLGIPVMIGDGTERGLLLRSAADRAGALASVTSDDRVNIAVSVAALAVQPDLRVVLRAGDDDAVTETKALFPIGVVRDVNKLAAARFADLAIDANASTPPAGSTAAAVS